MHQGSRQALDEADRSKHIMYYALQTVLRQRRRAVLHRLGRRRTRRLAALESELEAGLDAARARSTSRP